MNNIIMMRKDREPTHDELNSLTEQKDRLVIETICRALGRTDFSLVEVYPRGKWVEYSDGNQVFSFDGRERFMIGPPALDRDNNKYVQRVEMLWDKNDYVHQPIEVKIEEDEDESR